MGAVVSCMREATMSLFGCKQLQGSPADNDHKTRLERKLYIAKESPEPLFDLSECHLSEVPSGVYSICKVYRKEQLDLHSNKLKTLQDGGLISDLYLIQILNVSHNKLTRISDDIKFLVNLRELYLQNNFIEILPDNIKFLVGLQILDVSRNIIKTLTPSLGELQSLRKLDLSENPNLHELCPQLCLAKNLTTLIIDGGQYTFPPSKVATKSTSEIMRYLCNNMNIEYIPPVDDEVSTNASIQLHNPFMKKKSFTWEEQEAEIQQQEIKIHQVSKQQREKFLSTIIKEQQLIDSEIAKVQNSRDLERQRLLRAIQEHEKEIDFIINNFIQSDCLQPDIIQQQLAYEQAEHDRLLELTRQNYDNLRKSDVLKAMELIIEENYSIQKGRQNYEGNLDGIKQDLILDEFNCTEKVEELLKQKDNSRTELIHQLLEDTNVQKAVVASLIEKVDARSWSLKQEVSLISSHLAKLSILEQEKRKLNVACNFNELLQQRVQLVNLLEDLFTQQTLRRHQLIEIMKDMEEEKDKTTDFWLKNYQKLLNSAPKDILQIGKTLDPQFANFLLVEGVIHCLPFLVKFLFAEESLLRLTSDDLKANGVILATDRESIMRAIKNYIEAKREDTKSAMEIPFAPSAPIDTDDEHKCTGILNTTDVDQEELNGSECVVCMDAKCEIVFVPCGHMCCCQTCAEQQAELCPMCRTMIDRKIKVIIA